MRRSWQSQSHSTLYWHLTSRGLKTSRDEGFGKVVDPQSF